MSKKIRKNPDDEDDYEVIIVVAGVGDPIVTFVLEFGGKNKPTLNAPLSDVTITVSLKWNTPDVRIDVGHIKVNGFSTPGPHFYAIPYDDQYFDTEVENNIPAQLFLTISAKDTRGKSVKFGKNISLGNGQYLLPSREVTPQYFDKVHDLLKDANQK
jgi:hypothetical protein